MYLESSSLKNNGYYKKFGFEIKRDLYLGADVAAAAAASASSAVTTTTITTTTSNSSDDNNSDSGSAAHAPVLLTIMVREPRALALAHSIPIKLHSGFSSHQHPRGAL